MLEIGGADKGELTVDGGSMLRDGTSFTTIGAKGTLIILDGAFHERSKLVVNGTLIVAGVSSSAFVGQSPVLRPGTVIVGPGGTLAGSGLNMLSGFQFDLRRDSGWLTMVAHNDGVSVPEPATAVMLMFAGPAAVSGKASSHKSPTNSSTRETRQQSTDFETVPDL